MSGSEKEIKLSDQEFFELLEKKMRNNKLRKRLKAELRSLLTQDAKQNLYEVSRYLSIDVRSELGVNVADLYAYIQDPLVARQNPKVGILPFQVRWEPGLSHGPTSARLAVVDYCMDSAQLRPPAQWNATQRRFENPQGQALTKSRKYDDQFHQVNVWAVAQTVLDYFENGYYGMGRPIPWGFDGNRLILVPHAGFGENAFYDRPSKSLQFYYCGDSENPVYTCLSHDIIAHETAHALLDGIRPLYMEFTSVETAGFHEFVGDLTALLMILRRNEIRRLSAKKTDGNLSKDDIISGLAEEFGVAVNGSEPLRNAYKKVTMDQMEGTQSPHFASRVLTTAMFEMLVRIAEAFRKNITDDDENPTGPEKTAAQALNYAVTRFARLALRPIDMCPPVDVRFIDYARAVLHNYLNHESGDSPRLKTISGIIRDVFHEWGFCGCGQEGAEADPCLLEIERDYPIRLPIRGNMIDVARSRTAAYYYINDNRETLGIPPNQDLEIVDLYGLSKYGRAAHRLPREIVIVYLWREEHDLEGKKFGKFQDQSVDLLCGGTLILDEHANIISHFRKPGTESAQGRERLRQLREHYARLSKSGQVGMRGSPEVDVPGAWTPPVIADDSHGPLRLQVAPHMRETYDPEETDPEARPQDDRLRLWEEGEERWTNSF